MVQEMFPSPREIEEYQLARKESVMTSTSDSFIGRRASVQMVPGSPERRRGISLSQRRKMTIGGSFHRKIKTIQMIPEEEKE